MLIYLFDIRVHYINIFDGYYDEITLIHLMYINENYINVFNEYYDELY